jgi:hypothetical protein
VHLGEIDLGQEQLRPATEHRPRHVVGHFGLAAEAADAGLPTGRGPGEQPDRVAAETDELVGIAAQPGRPQQLAELNTGLDVVEQHGRERRCRAGGDELADHGSDRTEGVSRGSVHPRTGLSRRLAGWRGGLARPTMVR